jgi:nucleoid-associated protein YgaU
VRKWTRSACTAIAWSITVPLLAAAALTGAAAQANASTAGNTSTASNARSTSITRAALAGAPGSTARPAPASTPAALTALTAAAAPAAGRQAAASPAGTWTVRPGDTLSAIAAATAVPGGWPALYAANRHAIGPDPALIRPGTVLSIPGATAPARYTVRPGDTLTAIAAATAVPGGWPALYAANRQAIGPDPALIRPGTVLTVPGRPAPRSTGPAPARPRSQAPPPGHAPPAAGPPSSRPAPAPGHPATAPGHATAPAAGITVPARGMPRWLEDVLLTAGILGASALAAEPAAALARRRRATRTPARQPAAPAAGPAAAPCAAARARIILAAHERLIVTYSTRDDTVYVLTPPGEDPRAVLRAARLVLPESTYQQLAGHLGVPAAWPPE